ncbi:uncharacterized protein N0V89_007729 [Didymosphaeria variabile]|uniref:Carboxypeptidase n=1 Tax=Didymosphaeria variabile TaxID=1932322 RepID=A0A9W8XKP0_9PLEO|nr:uncharacterized protein N0V89_007729 [Didymosphaeria variabile]KAJ4352381.1 hypothetical protein N0V89_007729 [Didymosphaeria variabile]
MAILSRNLCALAALALSASAASFPPTPEGLTVVQSQKFVGVSISYKETTICETNEGVKGYSGYVHLPPAPEQNRNYTSNMWFWFFEARNNSQDAPLSVWLQGGPGVPSSTAALGENGPCKVLDDSKSVENNPWSWNDKVNMLYIDQPIQVGFSYDTLTNGTIDLVKTPFNFTTADFSDGVPETNLTFLTGTFGSKEPSGAWNTTIAGAPVMWEFMQAWLQEFPEYKSTTNSLSFWGESYGGHYVPAYANYFAEQNERLAAKNCSSEAEIPIAINTVGLINACIDNNIQTPFYPEFAMNNTYGIQAINESYYKSALEAIPVCQNLSATCVALADEKDPQGYGNVPDVNAACFTAYTFCFSKLHDGFNSSINFFDIAAPKYPIAFPSKTPAGYMNSAEVQAALGVPLNFTGNSVPISEGFAKTGDFVRGHGVAALRNLLGKGTNVALVYGDRDYQCNWLGGEAISKALSNSTSTFSSAGYTQIKTNETYVGGLVRQAGRLSFSRVFQAGHEVPYYQPETAYEIFNRVMSGVDVATGTASIGNYTSGGEASAWGESKMPEAEEQAKCYVWDVLETCAPEEVVVLASGKGVTEDFMLVGREE